MEDLRQYVTGMARAAKKASASLLTRDRRAAPAYEAVGVRYELLS